MTEPVSSIGKYITLHTMFYKASNEMSLWLILQCHLQHFLSFQHYIASTSVPLWEGIIFLIRPIIIFWVINKVLLPNLPILLNDMVECLWTEYMFNNWLIVLFWTLLSTVCVPMVISVVVLCVYVNLFCWHYCLCCLLHCLFPAVSSWNTKLVHCFCVE